MSNQGSTYQAVTQQPQSQDEDVLLEPIPGLPQFFEFMTSLDKIILKHDLTNITPWNKYNIFNKEGQRILHAEEDEGDFEERDRCGPIRSFHIEIKDNYQRPVLHLEREMQFCIGCCCAADTCCYWPIHIYDTHRKKIGMLRQRQACCSTILGVFDQDDMPLFSMAPSMYCHLCVEHMDFPLIRIVDGSHVGDIAKDNPDDETSTYTLTFPMETDPLSKVLMFCSIFIIEYFIFSDEVGGVRTVEKSGPGGMSRYT